MSINRRSVKAHRLAMRMAGLPLADNELACHTCDNPICVNPAHLYAGTNTDNKRDAIQRGRAYRPTWHGEGVPGAKLTEAKVRELRALYAAGGWTHRSLAARYGVSSSVIHRALHGASWAA